MMKTHTFICIFLIGAVSSCTAVEYSDFNRVLKSQTRFIDNQLQDSLRIEYKYLGNGRRFIKTFFKQGREELRLDAREEQVIHDTLFSLVNVRNAIAYIPTFGTNFPLKYNTCINGTFPINFFSSNICLEARNETTDPKYKIFRVMLDSSGVDAEFSSFRYYYNQDFIIDSVDVYFTDRIWVRYR